MNTIDTEKKKTIANFLSGKVIFITGGTGFLGQCLIERLLSATSELKKIYVLVRGKNGYSPESRIKNLMSKTVSISELLSPEFKNSQKKENL